MPIPYPQWRREHLLREEPGPILSETVLQRVWFEQLVRNPLKTVAGETIHVHHPGIWNHRAGPDFFHAFFSAGNGPAICGDVELHRHSSDWEAHAHDSDPAFRNVRLHLFWQAHPALRNAPTSPIRQIALEHQLSAPLTDLVSLFHHPPAEIRTGERPGHCHRLLLSLPPEALQEILEQAGWHRLRQRRRLAQARVASLGLDQATWIALAEGLGFSENRGPFVSLARSVPIQALLDIPDSLDRAAVLFGVAGLLPDPARTNSNPRAQILLRQLWDRWWGRREALTPWILPQTGWRLGAGRPNNSPYRRISAFVFMSHPSVWKRFTDSIRSGLEAPFLSILRSASDLFWDHFAAWDGRILPSSSRLIGADRAHALLFQVLAPLAEVSEMQMGERMKSWPPGGDAGLLRSASVRLLGVPYPPPDIRTHLAREGLLQMYKDFCRGKPCPPCPLPEFFRSKKGSPSADSYRVPSMGS